MVQDTESRVEMLGRKADTAEASGNAELAASMRREQALFEETLQATRESLAQANETMIAVHAAYARQEAFFSREAARWNL